MCGLQNLSIMCTQVSAEFFILGGQVAEAGKAQRALEPPDKLSVGQQSSGKSGSFC